MKRLLRISTFLAAGLVGSFVASGRATASDGVIELNQTCALIGCLAGDTPGFPITIASGAARSYKLTSDLQVPDQNTTAILITRTNVSLDLNGFSIQGTTTCTFTPYATCTPSGTGIGVSGPGGTEVRNGTIIGMGGRGVSLTFDASVHDLRVLNCGNGGIVLGPGGVARSLVASANSGTGVSLEFRAALHDSVVANNGGYGIVAGVGTVIRNNVVNSNQFDGLFCTGDCLATGNHLASNLGSGVTAPITCTQVLTYGGNMIKSNVGGTVGNSACSVQLGSNVCNTTTTCP